MGKRRRHNPKFKLGNLLFWGGLAAGGLWLWKSGKLTLPGTPPPGGTATGHPASALLVPAQVGVTTQNMVIGKVSQGAAIQAEAWDEADKSLGSLNTTLNRPTQAGYDTLARFPGDGQLMVGVGIDGAVFFKNGNFADRFVQITWREG